jgi:N-acetylglutamate synthase-like GNAT family acetyltransferase
MPLTISIRSALPGDAPAVSALLACCYPRMFRDAYDADVLAAALPLMTKASPVLLASGNYFVAEASDDEVVGCGGWSLERPGTREVVLNEGHIRHFATHPDRLRSGIGRALLVRCIAEAQQQDVTTLFCYSSRVAEPFYRSAGFVTIGPIDVAMPGGIQFPSIHMVLRLDRSHR